MVFVWLSGSNGAHGQNNMISFTTGKRWWRVSLRYPMPYTRCLPDWTPLNTRQVEIDTLVVSRGLEEGRTEPAQTLQDIAADPKHLGAEIGGFAVLHTWGQQLHHHPHLHCVLPAGGLALDGTQWTPCRPHFFLPVRVLSRRFRRLYLAGLEHLYSQGQLTLTGRCQGFVEPQPWHQFLADMRGQEWVVYAKPPLQEPQHVLTSLARYTHRVAISNHRLVALEGGQVTFRYKDYQRGHRLRTLTLDAVEFLRWLMLHVPPHGFHRLRHFGFLANRVRQEKLAQCRTLLGHATLPRVRDEAANREAPAMSAQEPGAVCPVCQHGRMQLVHTVYRQPAAWDLSVPAPGLDTS